jgi:hypothetical protein
LFQRLAAKPRADEYTLAPGMESRLQVVDLVADKGRLGRFAP